MSDEIKEILDRIETASEIFDCLLKPEECTELLDYITNLQQEIKEANDSVEWWSNRFKAVEKENERLKEWKEDLLKENIELENTRKEAIEYIDEMCKFGDKYVCYGDDLHPEYIIKILQNGSDKK